MRGNTTQTGARGDSGGADPYRLARVLVFDVYEKTRPGRRDGASSDELRRAAVSTANSLLEAAGRSREHTAAVSSRRPVSEPHRRAALEGLTHLSHWLDACVEEGSLSIAERRELDGLRIGLLEALQPAND